MVSLMLGILGSSMLSVFMRISEKRITNNIGMLAVNYLTCTVLGGLYALSGESLSLGQSLYVTTGMGLVNGVLYLSSFMLLQISVRKNGVVLSSTFMKLGLLVSMVICVVVYRERPDSLQVLGFVLALGAILLMNYRKGAASSVEKSGLMWLLLLSGMAEVMSKVFEETGFSGMSDYFLLVTFATAFPLALLLMAKKGQRIGKWEALFGVLIGVPNFLSSKLLLQALYTIPAVIAYPVYNVGVILIVTMAGMLLFRERLEKRQWLGLGMILIALVLLNT